MGNPRATRKRVRKAAAFAPAELEWLTDEPQEGANGFEQLELEYLCEPKHFDRADNLIDRAERAEILPPERVGVLRRLVREAREKDRRMFPKRVEYIGERIYA